MEAKNLIAQFRAEAGMTQESLGVRLGVNRRTVMRWESGETPIPIKRIKQIADFTGIPRETLRPDLFEASGHAQ